MLCLWIRLEIRPAKTPFCRRHVALWCLRCSTHCHSSLVSCMCCDCEANLLCGAPLDRVSESGPWHYWHLSRLDRREQLSARCVGWESLPAPAKLFHCHLSFFFLTSRLRDGCGQVWDAAAEVQAAAAAMEVAVRPPPPRMPPPPPVPPPPRPV